MSIALNTNSPSASSTAWKAATVTMNGGASTYLAGQSLGSSRTSQLAMIETADSVSPDCLTRRGPVPCGENPERHSEQLTSSRSSLTDLTPRIAKCSNSISST